MEENFTHHKLATYNSWGLLLDNITLSDTGLLNTRRIAVIDSGTS